jgi:hypothetical protein
MKKTLIALIAFITLAALGAGVYFVYLNFFISDGSGETKKGETEKCGELKSDETWSGDIHVICTVVVTKGAVLTIEPGTIVKFKHDRDYKTFSSAGLEVDGGTIKAEGSAEKQIWFTSDADESINGDWQGIAINNSDTSKFDYAIVEFGEMGIEQFDSAVPVTNSIIRWSNAEGLYAERSKPFFKNNTFYGNGYHDIALEQYNKDVKILTSVFRDSNYAIHHEETTSHIEGNYFKNYKKEVITAGMESKVTVVKNKFKNTPFENPIALDNDSGAKITKKDNDFGNGTVQIPKFNYQNTKKHDLGYIPGDPKDKYPYIYDEADETRKVVKKIGKGMGFGWSLTFAQGFLWRFDGDFFKMDLKSGKVVERYSVDQNEIMNPRGLAWGGEYFWVNDFSLLKIFKFKPKGDTINPCFI